LHFTNLNIFDNESGPIPQYIGNTRNNSIPDDTYLIIPGNVMITEAKVSARCFFDSNRDGSYETMDEGNFTADLLINETEVANLVTNIKGDRTINTKSLDVSVTNDSRVSIKVAPNSFVRLIYINVALKYVEQ
jgi:hypothetical protein